MQSNDAFTFDEGNAVLAEVFNHSENGSKSIQTRQCHSDGRDGVTEVFISRLKNFGGVSTHLILSGGGRGGKDRGNVIISPSDEDEFFKHVCRDFVDHRMLPISIRRTHIFPFYADFDLKCSVAVLSDEVKRAMGTVMNAQAQRFFDEDHPPLVCIICDKSGEADQVDEVISEIGVRTVMYKHGLHFHWPDVHVKSDEALRMRASMIAALDRCDWSEGLGQSTIKWEDIFDESVYGSPSDRPEKAYGGLRMVGAPKAKKCEECRNTKERVGSCVHCFRRGHVIDPRYYKLFEALKGEATHVELTRRMSSNFALLLKYTNVRCQDPDKSNTSEGWRPYLGCPGIADKTRKRKATFEKKFTSKPEITSNAVERIVRKYALKFSAHYANTTFSIRFDGSGVYKIAFRGDGSNFCLNMNDFHNSNNVYMIIKANSKKEFVAFMRCFCKCNTTARRFSGTCANFESHKEMLDRSDSDVLFSGSSTGYQSFLKHVQEYNQMKQLKTS